MFPTDLSKNMQWDQMLLEYYQVFSPSQLPAQICESKALWGPRPWKELKLIHRGKGWKQTGSLENTKADRVSPSSTWLTYLSLSFPPFQSPPYGSNFLLPHNLSLHGRERQQWRHWLEPVLAPSHFWVLQEQILWVPVKAVSSKEVGEKTQTQSQTSSHAQPVSPHCTGKRGLEGTPRASGSRKRWNGDIDERKICLPLNRPDELVYYTISHTL